MFDDLLPHIAQRLSEILSQPVKAISAQPIGGGCINQSARVITNQGSYFVKRNSSQQYPRMFECEANGLELLRSTEAIRVPKVLGLGTHENQSFIIIEFLQASAPDYDFWSIFGHQLAELHRSSQSQYGLQEDNYVGSIRQVNTLNDDWLDFFKTNRLEPLIKQARDQNLLDEKQQKRFKKLIKKLPKLLPTDQPALLHGDLWSGNFMVDGHGYPALVDPAVYYGHREVDLAMSLLFGGFDEQFYNAYNESYPLEEGFMERVEIYKLYPLLVHLNLFGPTYVDSIKRILQQFT